MLLLKSPHRATPSSTQVDKGGAFWSTVSSALPCVIPQLRPFFRLSVMTVTPLTLRDYPVPLLAGSVIRCRPLGMLLMEDESGGDMKMLAVPVQKLTPRYNKIQTIDDVPEDYLAQIRPPSLNTTKIWKKASGLRYPAGQVLKKPA